VKRILCALMALIVILALAGCGEKPIEEPEDIIGKRIAVLEGSSSVIFAEIYGSEVRVCRDKKELVSAVKLRDVDCALVDEEDEGRVKRFQFGIKSLKEPFMDTGFRIAAAKENPDLIADVNAAILYLTDEGIIKDIIDGHYDEDEFVFEHSAVEEAAKTLTVAVCVQEGPYSYYNEKGELCGIDIDVAKAVCAYIGLNCEFMIVEQDELIPAVWGGSAHFALGCITEVSANAEICIMSAPYAVCTQMIIVG